MVSCMSAAGDLSHSLPNDLFQVFRDPTEILIAAPLDLSQHLSDINWCADSLEVSVVR